MKRRTLLQAGILATTGGAFASPPEPLRTLNYLDGLDKGSTVPPDLANGYLKATAFSTWDSETFRTMKERARNVASSHDFGIDAKGLHSSTAEMNRLLLQAADAGVRVELGPGTIAIDDSLRTIPVSITGQGMTLTTIMAVNMEGKDLLTFLPSSRLGISGGLSKVTLVAAGANLGRAIVTKRDGAEYSENHTRYTFDEIYCRGQHRAKEKHSFSFDYSSGWWFDLGDANGIHISNIYIHGSHNIKKNHLDQFNDGGIRLGAEEAILTARMQNLEIGPIHTAVAIDKNVFFSLFNFDFVSCHNGLVHTSDTAYNEPKIGFGNINAQSVGLDVVGSSREVQSVTIRRHRAGWKGASSPWYGIRATASSSLRIAGCVIQPDESDGPFLGKQTGIAVAGGGGILIESNMFGLNLNTAISLDNVAGAQIVNNVLAGLSGTYIDLLNKSRRIRGDRPAVSAHAAEYKLISGDSSIDWRTVNFDEMLDIVRRPASETVELEDGAIYVSKSYVRVINNQRNLEVSRIILASWIVDGTEVTIQPSEAGGRISLIKGTGNMILPYNIILAEPSDFVMLIVEGDMLRFLSTSYRR